MLTDTVAADNWRSVSISTLNHGFGVLAALVTVHVHIYIGVDQSIELVFDVQELLCRYSTIPMSVMWYVIVQRINGL